MFLNIFVSCYYPTAIKGYQGIVFTGGVRMGRHLGGLWEKFVRRVSQKQ